MKKNFIIVFFHLCFFTAFSQIGINTTSPQAQLDIRSSNQTTPANTDGLLVPRIDTFPLTNPTASQQGILVYLTTTSGGNQPGFYYWDNSTTSWISFKGNPDNDWYEVGGTSSPDNINDNMYHLGNVAIGKNTANYPLEVDSNDSEIGINHSMTATSLLTTRKGIQNVVSGASDDLIYGFFNQVRNSGNGIHYGNYSLMSSIGSGDKYGTHNRVINGSGNKYGSYNYVSGAGNNVYGNYNFIENGLGFFQFATFNRVSSTNNSYKIGVFNLTSGSGNASHVGVANTLTGTGTGEQVAVDNLIENNGNGIQLGVRNLFSNTSDGVKKGLMSIFSNTRGDDYGIENTFNSTGTTGNQYGMRNVFFGNKVGQVYGVRNEFYNTGNLVNIGLSNRMLGNSGDKTGVENYIDSSGTGELKGTDTFLIGSSSGAMYGHRTNFDYLSCGTGNKYGYFVTIPSLTCGIHYGVYSNVEKSNSFAGYFLGRVSIGSSSLVNDNYILPLSRGTNGQVMQTDGSGNVTWQNPSTVLNNSAWTTTGNSGTNSATNFIGTLDNQDLVFKRNNITSGKILLNRTALGVESLFSNTSGIRNTALGSTSLYSLTTASFSTAIGANAFYTGNYSNSVAIGDAAVVTADNQVRIGDGSVISIGGFANWTNVSDARFKTNVEQNVPGLSFITKLKPVTYKLDLDVIHQFLKTPSDVRKPEIETNKKQEIQTGFIAQEVEEVAKELGFEFSGIDKPKNEDDFYGLRYAEFVVPIVKAVQEQQEIILKLQERILQLENKLNK